MNTQEYTPPVENITQDKNEEKAFVHYDSENPAHQIAFDKQMPTPCQSHKRCIQNMFMAGNLNLDFTPDSSKQTNPDQNLMDSNEQHVQMEQNELQTRYGGDSTLHTDMKLPSMSSEQCEPTRPSSGEYVKEITVSSSMMFYPASEMEKQMGICQRSGRYDWCSGCHTPVSVDCYHGYDGCLPNTHYY